MGALDAQRVVHQHQRWRLISCMWLHAAVFHVLANMLSLLFIGIRLEQEFGFAVRIGFLYLMSGFGGSLLSALFIQYGISVGASGTFFGLIGSMLSELTSNWTMYVNKLVALLTLLFIIIINVAVGILPHVDNFAHIGGFVSGFLLGFLFLICPQFKWLTQRNAPPGRVTTPVKSKHKNVSICIVGPLFDTIDCWVYYWLVYSFRGVNLNNHCFWCHYLSRVPTSNCYCKSQNIYCLIICCTFLRILTSALIFDGQKCLLINMIMVAFSRSSLACRSSALKKRNLRNDLQNSVSVEPDRESAELNVHKQW